MLGGCGKMRRALRRRLRQGFFQAMRNELMHRTAVAKAHLSFCRMHVHIHAVCGNVEKQHKCGMTLMMQNIGVGGANRVIDHLVAHKALIHIGVLRIGAGAGRIGGKYQSGDIQFATGLRQPNEVFGQLVRQHILNAVLPIGRRIVRVDLALMMQFEGAMRVRQRDAGKHFGAMRVLRRIGFEKFAPCGCIEIQIRHLYPRTDPTRCRRNLPCAAVVLNATGVCRRIGARGNAHTRYRGDRGQRLTAKPHGFDVLQLVQ